MTENTANGRKLLFLYRGDHASGDGFKATLEKRGWTVTKAPVSDFARFLGVWDVFRRRDFADYDFVVPTEYYLTWAVCLRLLFSKRPTVAALTFNQSKRLLLTGFRPVDWLLNRIWRRSSLFQVHSSDEIGLFGRTHDIPEDRFVFSHWGYDLPAHDRKKTKLPSEPFVTMIGRNNRDLRTFCAAVERAGVKGVLVTAGYMLEEQPVDSPDVLVLSDRPMEECLNYVAGSFAHLVLVVDAERGAGHISSVSAMHLGKPQIFSDVATLRDYLKDGFNGIAVPVGDVDAVADAIRKLRDDPALAERLGSDGRSFAVKELSWEASASRNADALSSLVSGSLGDHPNQGRASSTY